MRVVLNVAYRLAVVAACGFGIASSWEIAKADLLFRRDDADAIHAAIRVQPDAWPYYVRLSQLDPDHARDLLRQALALDPFDAPADIDLGLSAEGDGDYFSAEKYFKDAFAADRSYLPRWSLANFYLRRGNLPEFWAWAERAARMPPDDVGLLFQVCWRVEPSPEKIETRIVGGDPVLMRQFLEFLLDRKQVSAAAATGSHLLVIGASEPDNPLLLRVVDRLVHEGDAPAANSLWQQMMARGWVYADRMIPYNGSFSRAPLPVSFDWSIAELNGVHSWTGSGGLETELSGLEPENCVIAEEWVPLTPGSYRMTYMYRSQGIPPGSGLRWQLLNAATGALVVQSSDLSNYALEPYVQVFDIPPAQPLYRLRLAYQRALGTTRVAGTLVTVSIRLQSETQK
jgi:hypothetical protein